MATACQYQKLPKFGESIRIERCTAHGILNLLTSEVILDEPKVAALVREVVTAAVAKQMRVRMQRQPRALAG
jgi:hypothetical protein